MDLDLAAEIAVPTTRVAGRKRKSASDVKATSKKYKPANTRSKAERSKKGAKKAPETAFIDDAENIQPDLPTEALPAPRRH